jgi:hypothetical protein
MLIADRESKSDGQKGVHQLLLLLRVGSPVGSLLCLLTVSLHTLLALSCELPAPATLLLLPPQSGSIAPFLAIEHLRTLHSP